MYYLFTKYQQDILVDGGEEYGGIQNQTSFALIQGIVGCTPTNVPLGKSLYYISPI